MAKATKTDDKIQLIIRQGKGRCHGFLFFLYHAIMRKDTNVSYRKTVHACHMGNVVMATIINMTPILFVPLMTQYGLTFEQMGRLVLLNFATQVTMDMTCGRLIDHWGIRPFIVGGQVCAGAGFLLFAAAPFLFPTQIYLGLMLGTLVFSAGGGLSELLFNPIMSGIPGDETTRALSLMHSFYAWGHVFVVLLTTLLVYVMGSTHWYVIPVLWAILPFINALNFCRVPLGPVVEKGQRTRLRTLLSRRFFLVCILAMLFNGAMEITMGQWASSFLEVAAGVPKVVGDIAGVSMFACMMGLGRTLYGAVSPRLSIYRAMMAGAILCGLCYIVAGLSIHPILSVAACALCGLGVSVMWPGCVAIAAETYPLAGTTMFALISGAGNAGSSLGPWAVGVLADRTPGGLRTGLLLAAVFSLGMFFCIRYLQRHEPNEVGDYSMAAK